MGIAVFNRGLRRLPGLEAFLGEEILRIHWGQRVGAGLTGTAGWGRRRYARRAREVATTRGVPFYCLEDGFLRSVGLGGDDPPLSLVVDTLGIYYDAGGPSTLEALIPTERPPQALERARALITQWREARVSKYNHARESTSPLPPAYILVVDQTWGDASITHGQATAASFTQMLEAARRNHPGTPILLKIHPEVMAGRKRGHFDLATLAAMPEVTLLAEEGHPVRLLEAASAVYVVTSQMGFEALLWGKPVYTFGMPFYAGWGLTHDALPAPARRRGPITLEALVHAALIDYPRYLHPEEKTRCEVETVLAWMGLQRAQRERFPAQLHAYGFSYWKKPIVRRYFSGSRVTFIDKSEALPADNASPLILWGRRSDPLPWPKQTPLIRLEDGFLRSVGLGADLIAPLSWVIDSRGIYYDPRTPSDLEHLLEHAPFPPELLARAAELRRKIIAGGITKYNVGQGRWQPPKGRGPIVLVPGQVEDDASIRFGAPEVCTNLGLLEAVRHRCPQAYIVYKPHPDVVAGLRASGQGEAEQASRWADEIVIDAPMGQLLEAVDEVHLLTSLTGFEALMRGLPVTCYGQPFYAGWGLTCDRVPFTQRRTRRLELDALIAATLILYPTYVSRETGRFSTPERILDELTQWRKAGVRTSGWYRLWRSLELRWQRLREFFPTFRT